MGHSVCSSAAQSGQHGLVSQSPSVAPSHCLTARSTADGLECTGTTCCGPLCHDFSWANLPWDILLRDDLRGIIYCRTTYLAPQDNLPWDSLPWDHLPWDNLPWDDLPWDDLPHVECLHGVPPCGNPPTRVTSSCRVSGCHRPSIAPSHHPLHRLRFEIHPIFQGLTDSTKHGPWGLDLCSDLASRPAGDQRQWLTVRTVILPSPPSAAQRDMTFCKSPCNKSLENIYCLGGSLPLRPPARAPPKKPSSRRTPRYQPPLPAHHHRFIVYNKLGPVV